jgi:tetratricopeptide (TPR) repeat protein
VRRSRTIENWLPLRFNALVILMLLFGAGSRARQTGFEAGRQAYEASDYPKAAELLLLAATSEPRNAEIQLLLTKTHLELQQFDAAIKSGERSVTLEPKNSAYHEWLGRAYGERADHSSFMSALGFARKARKEFQEAVDLDERNFAARQALVEFDCAAPSVAGGGEDKAQPEIARTAALDAAEGHYAAGNCRRQKKDFAVADLEFNKALEGRLSSADRVFDIADYAARRGEAAMVLAVTDAGAKLAKDDPRRTFYLAVGEILTRRDTAEAQQQLRDYLKKAPVRNGYPRPTMAHYWLGQSFENQGDAGAARGEYETALKLEPKNKMAQEALKKLKKS